MSRRRMPRRKHQAAVGAMAFVAALCSCSRAWDQFDPREHGAGANAGHCNGMAFLADDFEDGTLRSDLSDYEVAATRAERDGRLVFTFPGAERGTTNHSPEHAYDLVGGSVSIEVVQVPPSTADYTLLLQADFADESFAEFIVRGNYLEANFRLVDDFQQLARQVFDPQAHRFWRIREQDSALYWEVSGDGQQWNERAQVTTAGLPSPAYTWLELSATGIGQGQPLEIQLDNLNGGARSGRQCATAEFVDPFDGSVDLNAWQGEGYSQPNCSIRERDGQLAISVGVDTNNHCQWRSSMAYDLRGSTAALEIVAPPEAGSAGQLYFGLVADDHNYTRLDINDGTLGVLQVVDGDHQRLASKNHSPAEERWWRFREQGGQLHWETSPDGVDWRMQVSVAAAFDLSRVALAIGGDGDSAHMPAPLEMRVDNLNLTP